MKKRPYLVSFVVVFLFIATSVVLSYSKHRGTNSRVSSLLILSMKARDAGQMDRALLFWKQAKSIRQGIAMPKWLREPLLREQNINLSEKHTVSIIASLPYRLAKPIMEDMLDKNPSRNNIRNLFVDKAQLENDAHQVKRHKSVIIPKVKKNAHNSINNSSIWKVVFLVVIILLAIWQIYLIVSDRKRKNIELESKTD